MSRLALIHVFIASQSRVFSRELIDVSVETNKTALSILDVSVSFLHKNDGFELDILHDNELEPEINVFFKSQDRISEWQDEPNPMVALVFSAIVAAGTLFYVVSYDVLILSSDL